MATTYEKIATTTLGSAAASINFSSIPGTFTDLKWVLTGTATSAFDIQMTFNSDTSEIYSYTTLQGSGSAASSSRASNYPRIDITPIGLSTTIPHFYTVDLFSYAGSTYKTVLTNSNEDNNGSGYVGVRVGLWRSTSAITSIQINASTSTFAAGSTATLYGILKA
jgi:hypothetical protein